MSRPASSTNVLLHAEDLSRLEEACGREPLHVPGAVQAHGVLLAVDDDQYIRHVSANSHDLLGARAGTFLGRRLEDAIGAAASELMLGARIRAGGQSEAVAFRIGDRDLTAVAHVNPSGVPIIEIEPTEISPAGARLLDRVDIESGRCAASTSFEQAASNLCAGIRRITGFGRVVLYRFDPDWGGEVVGEDLEPQFESFLGLHFPASDIPAQARMLYLLAPTRTIVDAMAEPSPLMSETGADGPLDLSRSMLRAVSSVHRQYLANMGVRSSMSLSIADGERLWGLVACHGSGPRHPSNPVRRAASLLVRLAGSTLTELDPVLGRPALQSGRLRTDRIVSELALSDRPAAMLAHPDRGALPLVPAGGLIVRVGGEILTVGEVPLAPWIDDLLVHLRDRMTEDVYFTDHLVAEWPAAEGALSTLAGLLAIRVSSVSPDMLVWIRPEYARTIHWAGDPRKSAVWEDGEISRLQPRASFDAWRQEVGMRSAPWLGWQVEVARSLQSVLLNVIERSGVADRERSRATRAERDLAVARTDLVRQRRAVLSMLADAADDPGSPVRLREMVEGVGAIFGRLGDRLARREDLERLERELSALELEVSRGGTPDPATLRAIRDRMRQMLSEPLPSPSED